LENNLDCDNVAIRLFGRVFNSGKGKGTDGEESEGNAFTEGEKEEVVAPTLMLRFDIDGDAD
jgi:hypothetical protein